MGTVLIVDDHADIGRAMVRLVKSCGHDAAYVDGGEKAVGYLRTHLPDLVILDAMMPQMDGFEVLRALRSAPETSRLPVVMFSAIGSTEFIERALSLGAADYWVKGTLDMDRLSAGIAHYLPAPARRAAGDGRAASDGRDAPQAGPAAPRAANPPD